MKLSTTFFCSRFPQRSCLTPFESKAILRTTSSKDLSRLSVNAVLLLIADQVFFLAPFVALRRVVHVVGLVAPAPALPTPRA